MKETPRIGVFICHCGVNIGGVVNVPEVVEYAKTLSGVVYAEGTLYSCSSEGLNYIREAIREQNLNRVVVASCTPRTHEPLFRATCEEVGINKYLFQMANIREHCSWVHTHIPEEATEKAKDIVRMAVVKARLLEPQEEPTIDVEPSVMVVGGGVAGMTSALCLANQGFKVYIVEKELELGGMLRRLHKLYPTNQDASEVLNEIVDAVKTHENISILTSAMVKDVKGFIGNFKVTIQKQGGSQRGSLKIGTIIVATGAANFEPVGMYGYKEYDNVITQLELEQLLKTSQLKKLKKVVMIQCVGAREEGGKTYCSRICCMVAIKNAMIIKERYPDADVYILFRDLQTYGKEHGEYRWKAKEKGLKFIKYLPENPPEVIPGASGKLRVKVYHSLLGEEIKIDTNLVVLSTPLIQHQAGKELSPILKVPLGPDDFFSEAHVKLRPVDFATDGIYVCGTAHGPKDVAESIAQAYAVASRAAIPMANKMVRAEAIYARVNEDLCIGCGFCEWVCRYGAVRLIKTTEQRWVSQVNEIMCKGCGVCAVGCPAMAIRMRHFTNEQVLAQIRTAFLPTAKEEIEPRILAFTCNWCSYAGADLAGVSRIQYPPNVRIIRLMCSGRIDPTFVFEAFRSGADGVLISGCHPGDCHYISGNQWAEARHAALRSWLNEAGLEPRRLRLAWISATEGEKFANLIGEMVAEIKKLGPSPLRAKRIKGRTIMNKK